MLDLECFEINKISYDTSDRMYGPSFKLPPVFNKVSILQLLSYTVNDSNLVVTVDPVV